jgi:hypothetical protein
MNGPEDAQDYLWLTQELWMEPEVWNWADQDTEIKASVRRMCCREGCNKIETKIAEYKRCAACKTVCFVIISSPKLCVHLITLGVVLYAPSSFQVRSRVFIIY